MRSFCFSSGFTLRIEQAEHEQGSRAHEYDDQVGRQAEIGHGNAADAEGIDDHQEDENRNHGEEAHREEGAELLGGQELHDIGIEGIAALAEEDEEELHKQQEQAGDQQQGKQCIFHKIPPEHFQRKQFAEGIPDAHAFPPFRWKALWNSGEFRTVSGLPLMRTAWSISTT